MNATEYAAEKLNMISPVMLEKLIDVREVCPASSSVKVFGTLSVDYPSLSSSELGDDDIYCNIPILACLRYSIPILLLITTYGYALLP